MNYYIGTLPYSNELAHFGIKGQKWGVRRYQNPDGTWTEAGKKRYAKYHTENGENRYWDSFVKRKEGVTTQQLGYTPISGRRGDMVQRRIARKQSKVISDSWDREYEMEKAIRKGDSAKAQAHARIISRSADRLDYGKRLQQKYSDLGKYEKLRVKAGYLFLGKSGYLNGLVYTDMMNEMKDNSLYSDITKQIEHVTTAAEPYLKTRYD